MGSVFKKAITVILVQAALLLATVGLEASRAQAGELTTSESIVDYARRGLTVALGDDYRLKPGTIEIEDEAGVDIGNAFLSIVGAEAKKYEVRFVAYDRSGEAYRGHIKMLVNAISNLGEDRENDNNTTMRGTDEGTGRMIKIQLVSYLHRSQPITPKLMYLVRISK